MRAHLVVGLIAGILGSALTLAWVRPDRGARAEASQPFAGPSEHGPPRADIPDRTEFTEPELVNIAVYENTNRGVVHITTKGVVQDLFFESHREGAGSGAVVDRNGHILTNHHVVEDAQRIRVTLFNGDELDATLVGKDPLTDMAVLRIDVSPDLLFPIPFGDSSHLRVGQHVFAIGNPFGLERTMTTGIISSLNRTLPVKQRRLMKSIIQIDAALNQGNSGGPLIDSRGRLIGMNTAIASQSGANTGVGFAIPVNTIARIVPELIANGRVVRPEIGIAYMVQTGQGPAVVSLVPGGPADRAGLRGFRVIRRQSRKGPFLYEESRVDRGSADVIVAVNDEPTRTVDEFVSVVESCKPGQEIALTILRDKQPTTIRVVLGTSTD
ncbi:MAG: trypsin-like serine protease [Planctomycetes bacterium]|nr:trypsin-like serine protease [Planctomycetota bacterium]